MLSHKLVFNGSSHFTADHWILAPPTIPFNHYFGFESQRYKTEVLYCYSMLNHTSIKACFEHFDLLTVNEPDISTADPIKGSHDHLVS